MDIRTISPMLSVSTQIQVADITEIAARGFNAIVNNRPDREDDDQPHSSALAEQSEKHGIAYYDVPVVGGNLCDADVKEFAGILKEAQGPVLAFCMSGTRSAMLWALSAAEQLDAADILETARAAGYDLEALRPRLSEEV